MSGADTTIDRTARWRAIARRPLIVALAALGTALVWQLAVTATRLPAYIVPPPTAVLGALHSEFWTIVSHAGATLGAAALGLLFSATLAAGLAAAFTLSRTFESASMPLVIAFRSAPVAAVAPIVMLFMGRSLATSVVVVIIVSFFPLLVNISRGLRAADKNAADLLHLYNASAWRKLVLLRAPAATPYFFAGLRVAAATALLGAMLAEWITGTRGLGKLILDSGEMRETELLWAAVVTAVVVGLSVFAATAAAERRVLRWRA